MSHNVLNNDEDDIINNFKYKYNELKYALDLKIKELQITEDNYKDILKKLQNKLTKLYFLYY